MKFGDFLKEQEETSALPNDVFNELVDASMEGGSELDKIREEFKKIKPTKDGVKKLYDVVKNSKFNNLKLYLEKVIKSGPAMKGDFRYFDQGQVNFLKSMFDLIRQGIEY